MKRMSEKAKQIMREELNKRKCYFSGPTANEDIDAFIAEIIEKHGDDESANSHP